MLTCPTRVKNAATTDGFPWIDSPALSPSDILHVKVVVVVVGLTMINDNIGIIPDHNKGQHRNHSRTASGQFIEY